MISTSFEYDELRLRRRLLFRLLKDFDFDAPEFQGEMISEPMGLDAEWSCGGKFRCASAAAAN